MWPGMTPAMKKRVLMRQSIPGPATRRTEMGGPEVGLVRRVKEGEGWQSGSF